MGAKYRPWGCPALASRRVPRKISRLGLKISRSDEFTTGLDEPIWWLIIFTAKNVHHVPDCVCSAVCSHGPSYTCHTWWLNKPCAACQRSPQEASPQLQQGSGQPQPTEWTHRTSAVCRHCLPMGRRAQAEGCASHSPTPCPHSGRDAKQTVQLPQTDTVSCSFRCFVVPVAFPSALV